MTPDEMRAKNAVYWREYYKNPEHLMQRRRRAREHYLRAKDRLQAQYAGHRAQRPGDFWSHVQKLDGCWLWLGAKDLSGYGRVGRRRADGSRVTLQAHRVAWEEANGPIPDGLWVLHHCDNPPCVNPAHLFLGTHLDNMADANAKGRWSGPLWDQGHAVAASKLRGVSKGAGEKNANAKLTKAQVDEIRRRHGFSGETFERIAIDYGVTGAAISHLVRGLTWREGSV